MSIQRLLSAWRAEPTIAGNLAEWRVIPARPARYADLPDGIHPELVAGLRRMGIHALYRHQAAAWQHAARGENFVVVTGTASGKTLCYNLPVVDRSLRAPEGRALFLFPTKALAQDQASALAKLLNAVQEGKSASSTLPALAIYDGDTTRSARPEIRKNARIVFSNPDMLHTGILPHHTGWAEFFSNLQYVVLDEIHVYRGVFGSHVANVLRRLKRIAAFYGSRPQFFLTSATIANPVELAEKLIEEPVRLVDDDGAARGPKNFLLYNPPVVDQEIGLRRSSLQESVRLAEDLLAHDIQTIIFGRSRRTVELLLTYLRERADTPLPAPSGDTGDLEASVRGYRSGYLPNQRREIESSLRRGSVRAVVATNALELGIDIGSLGAAVLVGYPGSIAATWQQAGRAGRGADAGLVVLVTTAAPLDQFLAAHPDYFFDRSPEQALINPDNLLILLDHLRCAAFELPFGPEDSFGRLAPERLQEFLEFLALDGTVHHSGERYFWMADQYPAQAVSLRSASADQIVLQTTPGFSDSPTTIGQVDRASAVWMVHPDAVYLHEGDTYLVESLDLDTKLAHLRPVAIDYYTEPSSETSVQLVETQDEKTVTSGKTHYGEIKVTTQVVGYRKLRWYTHENLGHGVLDLPPSELLTTGYWLSLPEDTVAQLQENGLWTNAPNDYGSNWNAIRRQVRTRDGYRCQVCGVPEGVRTHDVHHKIPFRSFPSAAQANQLENLITLCPACHHRAETAVRMRSGLAGLAFVLGHLAPFFLMCDTGDLGVHSDPQSSLAEGRPAVVLYDQIPAGIGLSRRIFEIHAELMASARELVAKCPCAEGCPSCVGPGGEKGAGGKQETLAILDVLNGNPLRLPS